MNAFVVYFLSTLLVRTADCSNEVFQHMNWVTCCGFGLQPTKRPFDEANLELTFDNIKPWRMSETWPILAPPAIPCPVVAGAAAAAAAAAKKTQQPAAATNSRDAKCRRTATLKGDL